MDMEKNIDSYINNEAKTSKRKFLFGAWYFMLIVSLPSALFGEFADITKFVMIPFIVIMTFWIIYLFVEVEKKKRQFILFMGIYSVFISMSFLIAAYKMAATTINVSIGYILLILFAFILTIFLIIYNTLRLVRKGHYLEKEKAENPTGLIVASSLFGLGVGKILLNKISQDTVVALLVVIFLFLGFLFLSGVHNLLKYYFIRKNQIDRRGATDIKNLWNKIVKQDINYRNSVDERIIYEKKRVNVKIGDVFAIEIEKSVFAYGQIINFEVGHFCYIIFDFTSNYLLDMKDIDTEKIMMMGFSLKKEISYLIKRGEWILIGQRECHKDIKIPEFIISLIREGKDYNAVMNYKREFLREATATDMDELSTFCSYSASSVKPAIQQKVKTGEVDDFYKGLLYKG